MMNAAKIADGISDAGRAMDSSRDSGRGVRASVNAASDAAQGGGGIQYYYRQDTQEAVNAGRDAAEGFEINRNPEGLQYYSGRGSEPQVESKGGSFEDIYSYYPPSPTRGSSSEVDASELLTPVNPSPQFIMSGGRQNSGDLAARIENNVFIPDNTGAIDLPPSSASGLSIDGEDFIPEADVYGPSKPVTQNPAQQGLPTPQSEGGAYPNQRAGFGTTLVERPKADGPVGYYPAMPELQGADTVFDGTNRSVPSDTGAVGSSHVNSFDNVQEAPLPKV